MQHILRMAGVWTKAEAHHLRHIWSTGCQASHAKAVSWEKLGVLIQTTRVIVGALA